MDCSGVKDVPPRLQNYDISVGTFTYAGRQHTLIVSSQLHPAMKTANKANRVTHFIIGLLSFVTLICIGVDVRNSTVGFFVGILPSWLFITKMPHLI